MYRLMRRANDGQPNCWTDIPEPDAVTPLDLDESAMEGDPRIRIHLTCGRSRALVAKKKAQALSASGSLACDVCDFDFVSRYGKLGTDFCEVHHIRALSTLGGNTVTRLSDLVIVCSNCHRMIHRHTPMLSISQLQKRLNV